MKKALIGSGGFAREIMAHMGIKLPCFVDDDFVSGDDIPLSKFDPNEYEVLIAVGDPNVRYRIFEKLPKNTKFFTFIHHSAQILDSNIHIGDGSVICANCILTTNIKIGNHSHLNLLTTIGHDTTIGDFLTTAPGAKVSGNCEIGDRVYIGTNASIKQKIKICDDVVIGLNAGVVKNIDIKGTYVGVPAKLL